jgi:hypothetical protein
VMRLAKAMFWIVSGISSASKSCMTYMSVYNIYTQCP